MTTEAPPRVAVDDRQRRRRKTPALAAGLLLVVAVVAVLMFAGPFASGKSGGNGGVGDNAYPTSLASVTRGSLSSQVTATGTLGYAAQSDGTPYSVVNQAAGTFSALPAVGQAVTRGEVLYRVSDQPVVLLYGKTPMYRSLYEGDTGPDVSELNANLVALGYAAGSQLDSSSDYFSAETAYALERLQGTLGVDQTGWLKEGQAVFLPGPLRVTTVTATLGTNAMPGAPIAQATSGTRQVVVELDASQQTEVKVGDQAQITLPNNQVTPGVVSGIGTVASSSSSGQTGSGSGSSGATLPVYIALKHPEDAGTLDQAPVQVQITTAAVNDTLIVPVDSLLPLASGAYAVETVDARGVHHLVAVTLGAFDDADGLVQVTGALSAGERIVVPNV